MSRIVSVTLDGYKGLRRKYTLGPATLLTGPNGTGKSSCGEAINFAITGRVPEGKQADIVATYFPERGGWVRIEKEDGAWIKRGITIDHEKKKVSEVLETSDGVDAQGGPVLTAWQASEAVLDLRSFTALSSTKRREYMLNLCGSGDTDASGVMPALEARLSKLVFGKGGTAGLFDKPPHTYDGGIDLPEETEELRQAWIRKNGLRDTLETYIVQGQSITEICLRLGDAARSGMLGARKAAKDAKSAARELEAEAQGARAAAGEAGALRGKVATLAIELGEARRLDGLCHAAAGAVETAKSRVVTLTERHEARLQEVERAEKTPAGPEPPDVPVTTPALEEKGRRVTEARVIAEDAVKELAEFYKLDAELTARRKALDIARAAVGAHERSEMGQIVVLLSGVPDGAHAHIPKLKALVGKYAADWKRREVELAGAADKAQEALMDLSPTFPDWGKEHAAREQHARDVQIVLEAAEEDFHAEKELFEASIESSQKAKREWFLLTSTLKTARDHEALDRVNLAQAEEAWTLARKRQKELQLQWTGKRAPEYLELEIKKTQDAQERAEKASGAAQAYDAALERGKRNAIDEEAWKLAEKAVAQVREKLVGEATAPLMGTLAEVLKGAARKELPYLELENDRGKPIFELGWTRGDQRIALGALSMGEAAIFGAALSVAIALRSPGLRVLLAEADPLDLDNLGLLLGALGPWGAKLDALCLATATDALGQFETVPGWRVIETGKETPAATANAA